MALAISTLIVLLGAWIISNRWDELKIATEEIGPTRTLLAVGLSGVGIIATGDCWRRWLDALAPGLAKSTAHKVFYVTQVGKYIPGGVWPMVGQVALARRFGLSRSAVLGATSLFMATHLVTGAALGSLALHVLHPNWLWYSVPIALLGLLALSPPVIRRVGATLLRRIDPSVEMPVIPAHTSITTMLLMLLAWLGFGSATHILLAPFGLMAQDYLLVIGVFALSWVVGFLAFLAPAGIGAREGAFVALLASNVGVTAALTAALLSRAAITVGDVLLGALSTSVIGDLTTGPSPGS